MCFFYFGFFYSLALFIFSKYFPHCMEKEINNEQA